jgi:hypothetical protein
MTVDGDAPTWACSGSALALGVSNSKKLSFTDAVAVEPSA